MDYDRLPDDDMLVLGIIRDSDQSLTAGVILKRSGLPVNRFYDAISRLADGKKIMSFPEDEGKKRESRRYFTAAGMREAVDREVAGHLWEMSAGCKLYFAYGSDLDPDEMYGKRCPESRFLCRGRIEGFSLAFDRYLEEWKGTVASIKFSESEGAEVWGVLYAVSPADWGTLDAMEGVPRENRRVRVPVRTSFGLVCADCYQSVPGDRRLPSGGYMDKIVKGAEFFGLPQKYIRLVKSLPVSR